MAKIFHAAHPIEGDVTLCGDVCTELSSFVVGEQSLPEIGFPLTCPRCLRIVNACVEFAKKQKAAVVADRVLPELGAE